MSDHKPCGPECGDTICTECAIAYTYTDVRIAERDRIVAIIQNEIRIHEELADRYSDGRRPNIAGWQSEKYAAQVLALALSKING